MSHETCAAFVHALGAAEVETFLHAITPEPAVVPGCHLNHVIVLQVVIASGV